jgi:hypothetical protein
MKQNVPLIVSSLLSILLTLVHVAHDIAIGIDESRPSIVVFVVVLVLWSYGTVALAERRSRYIIVFVLSLLAFGISVLHMTGKSGISAGIEDSGEALFFGATVLALGVTALLSAVLSTRGLWTLRRGQRDAPEVPEDPGLA